MRKEKEKNKLKFLYIQLVSEVVVLLFDFFSNISKLYLMENNK